MKARIYYLGYDGTHMRYGSLLSEYFSPTQAYVHEQLVFQSVSWYLGQLVLKTRRLSCLTVFFTSVALSQISSINYLLRILFSALYLHSLLVSIQILSSSSFNFFVFLFIEYLLSIFFIISPKTFFLT